MLPLWDKDLKKHLKTFSPPAPIIIIINDFEEEKHVEKNTIEVEAIQPIETKQLVDFLSEPVQGMFFKVEPNSLDIPIVVPTKA